jgi:hypothetical protein
MIGGVGEGVSVSVAVGGTGEIEGVCVSVGSGVRETCGVAVARGVSVISGASVLVGTDSATCCGVHAATPHSANSVVKRAHFRNPMFVRTIRRMTLIFLLLTMLMPVPKQADDTISLNPNRTAALRLDGSGAFATTVYDSPGGETITLTADGGALDIVVELLAPDGTSVAYADGPENQAAVLTRVYLDKSGPYTVRVNTFNGEGVGDVELALTVHEAHVLTPDEPLLWVPLGANEVASVALDGFEGEGLTITVRDPRGLLDPRIVLVDMAGSMVAENDDHDGTDPALNRFDARLTGFAAGDGQTLVITEFLGRPGWLEVSIRP